MPFVIAVLPQSYASGTTQGDDTTPMYVSEKGDHSSCVTWPITKNISEAKVFTRKSATLYRQMRPSLVSRILQHVPPNPDEIKAQRYDNMALTIGWSCVEAVIDLPDNDIPELSKCREWEERVDVAIDAIQQVAEAMLTITHVPFGELYWTLLKYIHVHLEELVRLKELPAADVYAVIRSISHYRQLQHTEGV